jgi:hypothetical protein
MILYPGRSAPVTSRRWEAVREGIEDYRILAALRARLEGSGKSAVSEDAKARIRHLLEVSVPRFVDQVMDFLQIPQNLDETLRAVRDEMMDCVRAVSG